MNKQLSIIGCGWLGLPMAKHFIAEGYTIKGSTTSEAKLKSLEEANIKGYFMRLGENSISGNINACLKKSETLIINIPPGLRKNPNKNHVAEITHLIKAIEISDIKSVLYISSTSVFEDEAYFPIIGGYTKPNATSNSAKQLIEIEQMLQENRNFKTTILRFGGLFDAERHPAKYLAGKKDILNPYAPINLIHKRDCIAIISKIIKNNIWEVSLNASHPNHPNKKDYYVNYCIQNHMVLPEFNTTQKSKGKVIDTSNLVQLLDYSFEQAP